MAYIDPMQLIQQRLQPTMQTAINMLPSLLANRRYQEQLAQRQAEWQAGEPLRQAQLEQIQRKREAEEAKRKLVATITTAGLPGMENLLPQGMTPQDYMMGRQAGVLPPLSFKQVKPEEFGYGAGLGTYSKGTGEVKTPVLQEPMIDTPYGRMPQSQAYRYMPELRKATEPRERAWFDQAGGNVVTYREGGQPQQKPVPGFTPKPEINQAKAWDSILRIKTGLERMEKNIGKHDELLRVLAEAGGPNAAKTVGAYKDKENLDDNAKANIRFYAEKAIEFYKTFLPPGTFAELEASKELEGVDDYIKRSLGVQ